MDSLVGEAESVLVAGPVLSGRRQLIHRTLHEWSETPIVVSTREPAESVRSTHCRMAAADAEDTVESEVASPVVVDCVTNALGKSPPDDAETKYAQHPSNLTSIGTKFTECVEAHDDGESIVVGIDTVSPLLMYADASSVFRFLHIVVQKSAAAGHPVVVGIDAGAHDEQTIEQFVPIFDRVVETRRIDGDRECRVRYPTPTEWRTL
ncbi:DUF7504 family protein [Halorubrum pallidum]|uniref:Recombinase RecA n=1 Tax=Halorubrum pallidum TaxID=1526114 RepID=A0ABD5T5A6_9EURY